MSAAPPTGDARPAGWGRRTAGGVAWSALAFAAGKAATLLTTLVLARLLVPEDFGLVAAALAYVSVVELLSDMGLRATVVYEQERGVTDRVQSAFTANLVLGATLALAGVLLAPLVASALGMAGHEGLFRLVALNPLLTAAGNIQDGLLLREMAFRRRIRPQLVRAGVRAAVSIALALAGGGAASIVVGLLAGSAAWTLTLWVLAPFRPTLRIDRAVLRSMGGYASGALALELVAVVGLRADAVVLAQALGAGALGLYAVAYRLPELVIENVSWSVSDVAFPALASIRASDRGALGAGALALVRWAALYAVPVAVLLAVLAGPLVRVAFGPRWAAAGDVLAAIALMSAVVAVSFPLGDVFKALGRQRTLVALNVLSIPVLVAAMLLAVPGGVVAVAWARAAVGAANCALVVVLVARALGLPARALADALRPAAGAAAGAALAAGAVRLAVPGPALVTLLAGGAAGLGGALAGVALAAPELPTAGWRLLAARRGRPVAPAPDGAGAAS